MQHAATLAMGQLYGMKSSIDGTKYIGGIIEHVLTVRKAHP